MVGLVNYFFSDSNYSNKKEQLQEYIILGDVHNQNKIYAELINEDSSNVAYHFNFIATHFKIASEYDASSPELKSSNNKLVEYYTRMSCHAFDEISDIGKFGRGVCFFHLGLAEESLSSFVGIHNQKMDYLNFVYGSYFGFANYDKAVEYLRIEIISNPDNKLAYRELANTYKRYEKPYELLSFFQDSMAFANTPNKVKRYTYFYLGDVKGYSKAIFSRFFSGVNSIGFMGALLILIVWFVYLILIHKYLKKRWLLALEVLFLGMFFAFGTSILTDFNTNVLGFKFEDSFFHDFLYSVIGIGMIEEFVKIIPLVLVMIFSKKLKEPIDYIVFASISALGFAFIENLIYFDEGGLSTIQGRSLSSTVTHMFNSSLVAYGIVIGKFAKKRNWLFYFGFFYLAAAVFHGFYDFWLINRIARSFSFITFIWLLVSMVLWVSMINNCLNNSYNRKVIWTYNPDRLNSYLLFGLSAIFLFEYLMMAWRFNAEVANNELLKDLYSGLFLLIFLTSKLSRFDYIPNYWAPLKFWDWNLLFSIPRLEVKHFNLKEIIRAKVIIDAYGDYGELANHFPIKGEVVKRELLSWEKDWYLIKLDAPVKVRWKEHYFILLKAKDENEIFLQRAKQPVKVRLVVKIDDLVKERKRKRDFLFVDIATVTRSR